MPNHKGRKRRPKQIAELIGGLMEPVLRKRGFATADLIANWPDMVSERYASLTQPERLIWPPRRAFDPDSASEPATLVIRCESAAAVFIQHEIPLIRDRINSFFGYPVVDRIKLVQKPVLGEAAREVSQPTAELSKHDADKLRFATSGIQDDGLRGAVSRLGRHVLAQSSRKADRGDP